MYFNRKKVPFNLITTGKKEYPLSDERGLYREAFVEEMSATGIRGRDTMVFEIEGILPKVGNQWKIGLDTINEFKERNDVELRDKKVILKIRPEDERNEITEPFWGFFSKQIGTAETAKKELIKLINKKDVFDTVKPTELIKRLSFHATNPNDLILDFFAGSGTTAHAVMQLNAEDGGNRKFILCQLDETIDEKKSKPAHDFCTHSGLVPVISSITIERVNRAGNTIKEANPDKNIDIGYKVFSLTEKPRVNYDENHADTFHFIHERKNPMDTLVNMLVATCKTLDTKIETIREHAIYKADNEIYVVNPIKADELKAFKDLKINIDAFTDINLTDYLNLDLNFRENMTVIY